MNTTFGIYIAVSGEEIDPEKFKRVLEEAQKMRGEMNEER